MTILENEHGSGKQAHLGIIRKDSLLPILIILSFALGPLQWITLFNAGLSIKPVHIPLFLTATLGWAHVFTHGLPKCDWRLIGPFTITYATYLTLLLGSTIYTPASVTHLVKPTIYFLISLGLIFSMMSLTPNRLSDCLYRASVATVSLFIIISYVTLKSKGINLFTTISQAIINGSPEQLQFTIFLNIFNDDLSSRADIIRANVRHTAMGYILIAFLVAAASWRRGPVAWVTMTLALLTILISVSRSTILAMLLALLPISLIMIRKKIPIAIGVLSISIFAFLSVNLLFDTSSIFEIISKRFGNLGDNDRVNMFNAALYQIDKRILLGYGVGYELEYGTAAPLEVHNLFLAAWIQGGILALFAATIFYFILVAHYLISCLRNFQNTQHIVMISILILPLFRTLISGNSGNFTLPEWTAISLFFTYMRITKYEAELAELPRKSLVVR